MRLFFAFVALFNVAVCEAQVRKICDLHTLPEISGMLHIQNQIWALNDGGNAARLYRIDTSGNILDSTSFINVSNTDWEELCANDSSVFIGDFGNNNGTRKDLRIFRFPISQLGKQNVIVDTILFYYPHQNDFTSDPFTIYDCEAFLAFGDSILIFSKSLDDALCRVYAIPNAAGNYPAKLCDSFALTFWVTGAARYGSEVTMLGYGFNGNLIPKMTTFSLNDQGLKQKTADVLLKLDFANQCESLFYLDAETLILAAEKSKGQPAAIYENKAPDLGHADLNKTALELRPNPATNKVIVYNPLLKKGKLLIYSDTFKVYRSVSLLGPDLEIEVSGFPRGTYIVLYIDGDHSEMLQHLVLR